MPGYPSSIAMGSADVGPDLIAPWRRPSLLVIYSTRELEPNRFGLVEAQGQHDASIILRIPHDRSVFPKPEFVAEFRGTTIPLADISHQVWDLHDLGGSDRLEAAEQLRAWLLDR